MMQQHQSRGHVAGLARLRRRRGETRPIDRLRAHYDLEVELAQRLRNAPKTERPSVYQAVYDELFAALPDHPQRTRAQGDDHRHLEAQLSRLRPYLGKSQVFLEIGAGDCRLALAVSKLVRHAIAVDVSDQLGKLDEAPENFSFVLSDGTSIPTASGSVDVAYSNQLMEHLHPEDALEQLANIYRVLKHDGVYYCITPNRLSGPHDISAYFDTVARGLHLKEYSYRELYQLFRRAGFRRVSYSVGRLGQAVPSPLLFVFEAVLDKAPDSWRPMLSQNAVVRRLLGIDALAYK
jgi:SAM-dependent methyltransferase